MDIRNEKQDAGNGNRHGHPAMRTLALAMALAALPAIGAGIDQAGAFDATASQEPATVAVPTDVATTAGPEPVAPTVAPIEVVRTDVAPVESAPVADLAPAEPAEPMPAIQPEAPTEVASLEPGEFLWHPEVSPSGPVVVIVSLPEQRAHVYRNGLRIGVSTISSGKPGHSTPTGTYPILQKRVEHYSNLYDDAPMPYMQRLTWGGIALHAGRNPGYPASHGCIRLPHEFAELLYDVTSHGTTVVVADESSHSADVVRPGTKSPVDSYTGLEMPEKVDVAALAQFGGHY